MNNTTNNTSLPPTHEAERIFKIVFYVFCFIIGTIGNFLVVIIVKGKKRHRTVNDYFIFNLAIADLTFLCFALPFYYYELFERFTKIEFYCKFVWPMMSITLLVIINTLTLMAVERCRAVVFPFRPRIKKPTLLTGITVVWLLSFLIMVPLMIVAKPLELDCKETWSTETHRRIYTVVLFVFQFALPIIVIAVAYITIVITLIKTKVPGRTKVNQRGQLVKQKTRAESLHIIRTVAIIVVLFVICMLPNQIAWILVDFGGKPYEHLSEKFWLLAEALMFFHSCVNPIIYGSVTRQFRVGYLKYLRYFCCCCQGYISNGIDLTGQHHANTKSRIGIRIAYPGSLRSPSRVANGLRSCPDPTIISSCRLAATPPSSARSTQVSPKRLISSPSLVNAVKPRPPSPLVINNQMACLDNKLKPPIECNNKMVCLGPTLQSSMEDKNKPSGIRLTTSNNGRIQTHEEILRGKFDEQYSRKRQHPLLCKNHRLSTNRSHQIQGNHSTVFPNPSAFEQDKKLENHSSDIDNSNSSLKNPNQSRSTSLVKEKMDGNISKKSSIDGDCMGLSELSIEEDAVQDTHL